MKKDLLLLVLFIPYFISSQVNITTINEIPEQCEWNCDGTIYFEATGTGTLYYSLDYFGNNLMPEDSSDVPGDLTHFYTNLCSGEYTLHVYDDIDTVLLNLFIFSMSPMMWVELIATDASCAGNCDGSIYPIINGGSPPYTLWWSNGSTSASIQDLCPGTYDFQVFDAFGCVSFEFTTINGSVQASDFVVYNDINQNCILEAEQGVPDIPVLIQPGNLIQTTDSCGSIALPYADGIYTATIDTANLNWSTNCPISQTFEILNQNCTNDVSFGIYSDFPCPDPDVSIFMSFMRPCFSNQSVYVMVSNSNTATGVMTDAFIDVELDPLIIVDSASASYVGLGNNVYQFEIDSLNPGESVTLILWTTVSCSAFLGQTLCMEASLNSFDPCVLDEVMSDPVIDDGTGGILNGLPEPCTLPWDQSSLTVDGWCENDSIFFEITNTGDFGLGDMECYAPVWITIDGVVISTDSIMIQGGETLLYSYAGNGQTWILNAEQHPLHPGNSHPNAHVEACGDFNNWTPNLVNDFPLDDADPIVDIYCGTVTGSFDPNDKTGYPTGQTSENYIQPNQQLQYVVRFQNTGTDTAFTVVIRDTLDLDLNVFSVVPGVASHSYTFKMYGPRVLEWTFENILLPDSTTNLEASNGFITFHVDQLPDLTPGTLIENDADIYFDFNPPIITNETYHNIFVGFVEVDNPTVSFNLLTSENRIKVYPNPTKYLITIESEDSIDKTFSIFDQQGRVVIFGKLKAVSTDVSLENLSRGAYTIQVEGNYKPVVIVKD
ncbi:MAG: T9SS type A sorting domain-containing protein [Crocinitomicaceae bacterium]|jgi:uncharacterized repeat protein (TIGR01451 family)